MREIRIRHTQEEAYIGLMPSVQDYATVGRLYEAIKLNMSSLADRLGQPALFVGPASGQVGRDVVDLEGLITVCDLASGLRAIDTIVEQGEGAGSSREDSHYERFIAIQGEFKHLLDANPSFRPSWPAAENPVMRRPPEPDGKVFVDDALAAQTLDFANAVYSLLLRCLVQSFGATGAAAKSRSEKFLSGAIGLMHVLATLGAQLARIPDSPSHPGVNAGMTFTMLRSVEPLFFGASEQQLRTERGAELLRVARRLAQTWPELHSLPAQVQRIADSL